MLKKILMMASLIVFVLSIAGCGGGGQTAVRITGLSPESVVKTFFTAAKSNHLDEAALYVSAASKNNPQSVLNFVTGQTNIQDLQDADLFLVKQLAVQGDYAVVGVMLKKGTSFPTRLVGMEKVGGEWYIVDFNQIYNDAKYSILKNLLGNVKF